MSDENRYGGKFIFLAMRREAHTAHHLIEVDLLQRMADHLTAGSHRTGFRLSFDDLDLEQAGAHVRLRNATVGILLLEI